MNRYLLVLSCSLMTVTLATTALADNQLSTIKDLYLKEFQGMDSDGNGQISKQEYLTHKFNALRNDIANVDGFDEINKVAAKTVNTPADITVSEETVGVPAALHDMANFELSNDDLATDEQPARLTKEDVMPKNSDTETNDEIDDLDLSISEEENLQRLMAGDSAEKSQNSKDNANSAQSVSSEQVSLMLDTIKKTLPKKIDEVTTWVDITYANNLINYVYQAEIDMTSYSSNELEVLKHNIQNEACTKAYADMCPRIKPMFIDRGIDMRIIYLDKNNDNISSCEFNKSTCN